MAITKQKKADIKKDLTERLKSAQSVVFVNFHKLPVSEVTSLRSELRKNNSGYVVAKKTLLALALRDAAYEGTVPVLDGEVAVAYGPDELSATKEVAEFAKAHAEGFKVLGGVFEGRYIAASQVIALGNIPSREVLYSQLLSVFNGPVRSFATVIDAIAKKKGETVAA